MLHFLPFAIFSTEMLKPFFFFKFLQKMSTFEYWVCFKMFETDMFLLEIYVFISESSIK